LPNRVTILNESCQSDFTGDSVSLLLLISMETIGFSLRTVVSIYLIVCDQTFGPDLRRARVRRLAQSTIGPDTTACERRCRVGPPLLMSQLVEADPVLVIQGKFLGLQGCEYSEILPFSRLLWHI
jgi:hypothetical protein